MGRKSFLAPTVSSLAREFRSITPRPQTPRIPEAVTPAIPSRQENNPLYQQDVPFGYRGTLGVPGRPDMSQHWADMVGRSQMPAEDPFANPGGWSGGGVSNAGGEWSTLDGMNAFISQAAQSTGVPPNLINAIPCSSACDSS